MAVLLNCDIPKWCRFDRKHYFYPDMPQGYQITQKDHPIAENGNFEFYVHSEEVNLKINFFLFYKDSETYKSQIGIQRIQLEMDSGKTINMGDREYIDFNRVGVSLTEIVTEPELKSPLEAFCFVEQIRLLMIHNQICTGEMHR